jgi:hypothetical protein
MLQRNMVKCNCFRLKYLVLYYKRVIALILRNIVLRSISYCTCNLVQYDILLGTIFLNISAITLYYISHILYEALSLPLVYTQRTLLLTTFLFTFVYYNIIQFILMKSYNLLKVTISIAWKSDN